MRSFVTARKLMKVLQIGVSVLLFWGSLLLSGCSTEEEGAANETGHSDRQESGESASQGGLPQDLVPVTQSSPKLEVPADVRERIRASTQSRRPNLAIVLIDTLRPDHLDLYGYSKTTAPYVADLGKRSVVFSRAYSTSSWTAPATASLFTGLYPTNHGVVLGMNAFGLRTARESGLVPKGRRLSADLLKLNSLPGDRATIPEIFKKQGYRTFGLSSNINVDKPMGFHRGFDQFRCKPNADAEQLFRILQSWENELSGNVPTFLYLHFMDVHIPRTAREPWYVEQTDELGRNMSKYDSEISYLDHYLEIFHQRFGWDDNTILVIVSDHGEEFLEHGQVGHKYTLHMEVNRVLLMIYAKDFGLSPRVVPQNVSLIDILPTLLEFAGATDGEDRDGDTLTPLLFGEPNDAAAEYYEERTVFAHRLHMSDDNQELWAAIQGEWKLIESNDGEDAKLYNLSTDFKESRNLAEHYKQVRAQLGEYIELFRELRSPGTAETVEIPLDEETLEMLEALGYVGDP